MSERHRCHQCNFDLTDRVVQISDKARRRLVPKLAPIEDKELKVSVEETIASVKCPLCGAKNNFPVKLMPEQESPGIPVSEAKSDEVKLEETKPKETKVEVRAEPEPVKTEFQTAEEPKITQEERKLPEELEPTISLRPYVEVTITGDPELGKALKQFLDLVLDWKITDDLKPYKDYLEDDREAQINFFVIERLRLRKKDDLIQEEGDDNR